MTQPPLQASRASVLRWLCGLAVLRPLLLSEWSGLLPQGQRFDYGLTSLVSRPWRDVLFNSPGMERGHVLPGNATRCNRQETGLAGNTRISVVYTHRRSNRAIKPYMAAYAHLGVIPRILVVACQISPLISVCYASPHAF